MTAIPAIYGPGARIDIVGLGAGTLACYAKPDQHWTFYEIDPAIVTIASDPKRFTFLSKCLPDVKVVIGDARLTLAATAPNSADVLAIDAFSSDAVPMHLLTAEAFATYRRHIAPNGLLMVHISNRFLDLEPVLAALAAQGWASAARDYDVTDEERKLRLTYLMNLGEALLHLGSLDESEEVLRQGLSEREELYGLSTDELRVPEERASIDAALRQAPEAHWASSARHVKKDGSTVFVQGVSRPLPNPEGRNLRLSVVQDVTLAERLAEQVRRNQKMDAIGSLAGGVAHDFNNLLSIILTSTSLILERLPGADPLRDEIEQIQRAGERASELTRRLLAFGRQQILSPRVVSISQVVRGVEAMARRLVGEAIEITLLDLAEGANVRVDPSQLEQVVMNLVANARDAMREGGRLTIEIVTTALDETYAASHHGVVPGEYVMLAVTDTGVGMPPEVQQRMFEPFFTTKRPGDGTGLGLATVFGIVKQSGGHVWVYSEVGKGSTFKVYLPRVHQDVEPVVERAPAVNLRGTETILLVEDEDAVRKVIRTVLIRQGYNVLEARNGGEALLTCERYGARIHLLLTDVVMPQMSGRELAERLSTLRPEMRVLYVSGYTENSIVHNGVLDAGIAFLQKPILPAPLCRKVREVLDAPPR